MTRTNEEEIVALIDSGLEKLTNNPDFQKKVAVINKRYNTSTEAVLSTIKESILELYPKVISQEDIRWDNNLLVTSLWNILKLKLRINALTQISLTDTLTKIGNRRSFEKEMSRMSSQVKRSRRQNCSQFLFCLLIDVDHFKSINDTFGHAVGDKVLVALAKVIQKHTRDLDFPARIGGEEFALLILANTEDTKKIVKIAERLREDVEEIDLKSLGIDIKIRSSITISVGISAFADDTEEMFKKADINLYTAKKIRNKVVFD